MSDEIESEAAPAPAARKGKKKLFIMLGAAIVLCGGIGGGLYAAGIVGGAPHAEAASDAPKLVPKSEQKRAGEAGEGGGEGGGHGGGEEATPAAHGKPTPGGTGGDKFASNYFAIQDDFTANLQDSDRFIQVGVAISTPYDDTVIEHLKTNAIAVRSAVLMTLGDTSEDQVATGAGKAQLQRQLVKAINTVLKEKEGFGGVGNVYFTNFVVQ